MTAADMDVRPGQRVAPPQPHRAPASRLARLLLQSGHPVRLLVLLLAMSMSACIIPVGPEFHDPVGNPNASPIISSPRPEIGMVSTRSTFEIWVEDPNVQDTLYLRWIVDYPPFTLGTTVVLPTETIDPAPDGMPRAPVMRSKTFACLGLRPLPTHQIMVIVSDREFRTDEFDLAAVVSDEGHTVTATWTWDAHDCPQQP